MEDYITVKLVELDEKFMFQGPRFKSLGNASGEEFVQDYLMPLIKEHSPLYVVLDFTGTLAYSPSFLDQIAVELDEEYIVSLRVMGMSEEWYRFFYDRIYDRFEIIIDRKDEELEKFNFKGLLKPASLYLMGMIASGVIFGFNPTNFLGILIKFASITVMGFVSGYLMGELSEQCL